MSKTLTVLHLSDTHLGKPGHVFTSDQVLRSLFEDISVTAKQHKLRPSMVIFSGDLVFGEVQSSPIQNQFSIAKKFIDSIYEALNAKPLSIPIVFVPGNHDINRTRIGGDQTAWIREKAPKTLPELDRVMQQNDVLWQRIADRQREWRDFIKNLALPWWQFDDTLLLSTGELDVGGTNIGIAAINSSWSCEGDRDQGYILVGAHQLYKCNTMLQRTTFRIIISHHPLSWLNQSEQNRVDQLIEGGYKIHFHGHEHSQWFKDMSGHLKVAAGACYEGAEKPHGYNWTIIDLERKTARIILRSYTERSGWSPMVLKGKTDQNGLAEIYALFTADTGRIVTVKSPSSVKNSAKKKNLTKHRFDAELSSLLSALHERFNFRWERPASGDPPGKTVVYWPVRLRPPTPIHAVQCFAAAGLQKSGNKVVLCVDDLGHVQGESEFYEKINKWFGRASGDDKQLEILTFRRIITAERAKEVWRLVQKWLGVTEWDLERVLRVSKLHSEDLTLEKLLAQRPRRLLTPALVWACLQHISKLNKGFQIITLGGYDERHLWEAWRELVKERDSRVGHLYIPELQQPKEDDFGPAVHMSTTNLAWYAVQDIEASLLEDWKHNGTSNWLSPNRLFTWCLTGCVKLPSYLCSRNVDLTIEGQPIVSLEEFASHPREIVATALSRWAEPWLL